MDVVILVKLKDKKGLYEKLKNYEFIFTILQILVKSKKEKRSKKSFFVSLDIHCFSRLRCFK